MKNEPVVNEFMFDFSVLRSLRQIEGLTINDVSKKSGISTAVISKLERNRTNVSLDTLNRLSPVFGTTTKSLISIAEAPLGQALHKDCHSTDGFTFTSIHFSNLSCFLGQAPKGARKKKLEIFQHDYVVCWVIKGLIRLSLPNEVLELKAGESAYFDAIQEHRYEALEDSKLIVLKLKKKNRI